MSTEGTSSSLDDFASHLQVVKAHHRRYSALLNKSKKQDDALSASDFMEFEGEGLLLQQLIYSVGQRFLAITPPASFGTTARPIACAFTEVERKSDPEVRSLATRYDTLKELVLRSLTQGAAVRASDDIPDYTTIPSASKNPAPATAVTRTAPGVRQRKGAAQRAATTTRTEEEESPQISPEEERQRLELMGLVERSEDVDAIIEAEKKREALAIQQEVAELHKLQAEMNQLTAEHQEGVDRIEDTSEDVAHQVESGRNQLLKAASYQTAGAWIGGAVVGGLVAGPVGMLAGAKSAGVILGVAAAGSVTGGVATSATAKAIQRNNAQFEALPPPPSADSDDDGKRKK